MARPNNNMKCRVCLNYDRNESDKFVSMFEVHKGVLISDKINSIANVNIVKGDGLPDLICPHCFLQLENAILFKEKCEVSNKTLWDDVILAKKTETQKQDTNEYDTLEIKEEVFNTGQDDSYTDCSDLEEEKLETPVEYFEEEPVRKSRAIDLQLICDDCGGSFKSKCKIRVHWKKVHEPEKLICPQCFRMFKSYKAFNLHRKNGNNTCKTAAKVRIEGKGKSRIFHCKDCNYKSKRLKDMDTHLVVHTGDRRYQCNDCPRKFTQHASLQAHRESTHKDYRVETTCHLCGKHLQGRGRFYKHMRIHRQTSAQCKICNKVLKSQKYLDLHMLRHGGVKSFSCEVCAASFFTYCELYNHRSKVHNKSKKFTCDKCEYSLHTKAALKKHQARHTGTNMICLHCGQFSENAEKLALHQRRHFDRNIQCPQCENMYHNKRSLYKHMGKHHRCKMLVEKREDSTVKSTKIKEENPNQNKEEIVILLSPPEIILK